jgi:hypothetical protein
MAMQGHDCDVGGDCQSKAGHFAAGRPAALDGRPSDRTGSAKGAVLAGVSESLPAGRG